MRVAYEGGGSEPAWRAVAVTAVFRAVPGPGQLAAIGIAPGVVIWTPPFPCLARAFTINDDAADPLTPAGGATNVAIGVDLAASATALFLNATPHASFGTVVQGWGIAGPLNSTNVGNQDSGIVLAPLGSIPGRPTIQRTIRAFSNLGTYTGTLRFRFEMRPFAGLW